MKLLTIESITEFLPGKGKSYSWTMNVNLDFSSGEVTPAQKFGLVLNQALSESKFLINLSDLDEIKDVLGTKPARTNFINCLGDYSIWAHIDGEPVKVGGVKLLGNVLNATLPTELCVFEIFDFGVKGLDPNSPDEKCFFLGVTTEIKENPIVKLKEEALDLPEGGRDDRRLGCVGMNIPVTNMDENYNGDITKVPVVVGSNLSPEFPVHVVEGWWSEDEEYFVRINLDIYMEAGSKHGFKAVLSYDYDVPTLVVSYYENGEIAMFKNKVRP